MLKNIIFDMGGVLIDLDRLACIRAFERLGFADVADYIGDFVQSDLFLNLEEGRISPEQFCGFVRKKIGNFVSNEAIYNAWRTFLLSIPDEKLEMLLLLKKKYRVFLLSNTNPIHFEYIEKTQFGKDGHSLSDYFDKCYLSYQLHRSKPHADIFCHMRDDAGLIPAESLLVDDGQANVEMAGSLGFQTYLAKPFENFKPLMKTLF